MSVSISPRRRALLAGGFAAAFCAPLAAGLVAEPASSRLASCPGNEVLDPISGACRPQTDHAPPTFNPLNPENAPLQPGSITSSAPGEVGQLPEVNGIPCNGNNTGLCIGLTEQNNMLEARPENPNVYSP
jgi:hypothetical protein